MDAGLGSPDAVNIRKWASAAKDGDREAFGKLVQAFQGAVFGLALRITGNAQDAEDVAQESFIRAYQALVRFDPERPFAPWILKIAANRALSMLRSRKRTVPVEEDMAQEPLDDRNLKEDREAERLQGALGRLSPEDRVILALRYDGEQKMAEIAGTLGIREGAAKVRLFRARERLMREMGGEKI